MLNRIFIAAITCVLYGLVVSFLFYFTSDATYKEEWTLFGTAFIIMIYSSPFFLIIGVVFSYFIDYLFSNKKVNYLFISFIYAVSASIIGGIVFLFFKEHYSLFKVIAYFVTAAITLSIAMYVSQNKKLLPQS